MLSRLAPRLGLVLLLATLLAFEGLFVTELNEGVALLDSEAALRTQRATDVLHAELQARLDVAEARLEALETLPLLEEDGLYWKEGGLQRLPRVAGLASAADHDEVLRGLLDGGLPALDGGSQLAHEVARAGSAAARVFRAWPWLSAKEAAALCVALQRESPRDEALRGACQRGLAGAVVDLEAGATPSLQHRDGATWLVVRRGDDARGVLLDRDEVLRAVKQSLERRALVQPEDAVAWVAGQPLPSVALTPAGPDPRARLRSAFWWKTALLVLTALLGLAVAWLARLAERKERATLELQRQFISTVSHELRTPIAAIRALSETLERKLGTEGAAKDYPRRLVAASDGLQFLVDNILSFNRIEAGRLTAKKERFSFAALEPLLTADAALALDRVVHVRCEGLGALPSVPLDAELVRILVLNLLRNAWKHARPEAREVHVTLTGAVEAGAVVLRFADDGPGIPEAERERVFEAFHRLDGVTSGGAGLGLALARRIAELHGGTLRVEPSVKGATFVLRLPS